MNTRNKNSNQKENRGSGSLDATFLNEASRVIQEIKRREGPKKNYRRREGPPTTIIDGIMVEEE